MAEKVTMDKVEYLGDGLYVKWDGYQIWLLANDHQNPSDSVALDSHTLNAFLKFIERLKENKND